MFVCVCMLGWYWFAWTGGSQRAWRSPGSTRTSCTLWPLRESEGGEGWEGEWIWLDDKSDLLHQSTPSSPGCGSVQGFPGVNGTPGLAGRPGPAGVAGIPVSGPISGLVSLKCFLLTWCCWSLQGPQGIPGVRGDTVSNFPAGQTHKEFGSFAYFCFYFTFLGWTWCHRTKRDERWKGK